MSVICRRATADDAEAVAALHAESWRRHYRIAYSDDYLDGDLLADRLAVWRARLGQARPETDTTLAERRGALVGFVHVILDADPVWGALVDNLHVALDHQRGGAGRMLLRHAAEFVTREAPGSAMHVWVLHENHPARAFYEVLGGQDVECVPAQPPGGDPANLRGSPMKRRVAWADPAVLT